MTFIFCNASDLDKYKCGVCSQTINEPVQTECGHRMCFTCVKINEICPFNDTDCFVMSASSIFKDKSFAKELDAALVTCSACLTVLRYGLSNEHLKTCKYRQEECAHCHVMVCRELLDSGVHATTCCINDAGDMSKTVSALVHKLAKLEAAVAMQNDIILGLTEGKLESACNDNAVKLAQLEQLVNTQNELVVSLLNRSTSPINTNLLENKIVLSEVRIAELESRMNISERMSFNGILTWKIDNFTRKRADALCGKTNSIYSNPFYTSTAGYKVCARFYPNGDGMGKNTHCSLFFVVMKGEFDAILKWPFKQRVTFMLLDVENGNDHHSDSFFPDISSTSFKRPTNDMNIASGCPLFVPQHKVEQDKYYNKKEDFIILRVIVHECPT